MNIIVSIHLLLSAFISICSTARLTDDQLAQILTDKLSAGPMTDSREYPSVDDINEFDRRLAALEKIDDVTDRLFDDDTQEEYGDAPVRKRPFCNGFTGCGRLRGKRLPPTLLDNLRLSDSSESLHDTPSDSSSRSKRPFCNGFFGCGNPGKRIVFRNPLKGYRSSRNVSGEKRFFCNPGAFGCSNPGKRSSLLERMRTVMNSNE